MTVNALAGLARDAAASPFMRGLTALPYRLAGAPVDLADMVVRPIANAAGIPIADPENMYGTSDWMIKQAMDAGLLMPRTDTGAEMAGDFLGQIAAPGVGPAEAGTMKAIFAGPLALTADRDALARATARLDAGDDPAKVWAEEGWFRGPDGKMRFEIDDSQATIRGGDAEAEWQRVFAETGSRAKADAAVYRVRPPAHQSGHGGMASGVMSHQGLYGAYPEIQSGTKYSPLPFGRESGSYNPETDTIGLSTSMLVRDARSTMLHELQHAVQGREGFSLGGMSQGEYFRLAGEAEARAVQARRDLTPEQRRARYPLQDYDVPLDELIIRGAK